jgi:hypothetical protein
MFSLDRILLPIDFLERCLAGARYTVPTLAKQFAPEITVLHVLVLTSSLAWQNPG